MRQLEKSGKTIDEAVLAALTELGLDREQVEVEVIEEPSKGLFGLIGNKLARVLVKEKVQPLDEENKAKFTESVKEALAETPVGDSNDKAVEKATSFLTGLFKKMDLEVELQLSKKDDYTTINFVGPDLGVLIGRRGDTLDALQYLVNLVGNRNNRERTKFILDVEGYRKRREETLSRLAVKLADKVKRKGKDVILEPMNPHERRIIHTALQDHKEVFTYSEGEEPYRKIIISPKK